MGRLDALPALAQAFPRLERMCIIEGVISFHVVTHILGSGDWEVQEKESNEDPTCWIRTLGVGDIL